jgi:hypothetical protein
MVALAPAVRPSQNVAAQLPAQARFWCECARAYPRRHGYPARSWHPTALRSNDGGGKGDMRTSVDSFKSVCQLHSVNRNWQTGAVGRRVRMSH